MRGLILSGGGVKGSYQVGVLQYLIGDLKRKYDIYCGVSVGGINAAHLAQFNTGQEFVAVRDLTSIWSNIESKHIYKKWKPFGQLSALFKPSFYDGSPLHYLINNNIDDRLLKRSDKTAYVGCSSITSGEYRIFNSKEPNFLKAVIAGASFPIMLNPVEFEDQHWVDGGIQQLTPIAQGIKCGCDELDIVITNPENRYKKTIKKPSIIDALRRALNLATDQIMSHDVTQLIMYNKLVAAGFEKDKKMIKVNIIRPHEELVDNQMVFKKHEINKLIIQGYNDAKNQFK